MLQVACERLHLDGLVFVPSQYHVAAYSSGYLTFLDPDARARLADRIENGLRRAMERNGNGS